MYSEPKIFLYLLKSTYCNKKIIQIYNHKGFDNLRNISLD